MSARGLASDAMPVGAGSLGESMMVSLRTTAPRLMAAVNGPRVTSAIKVRAEGEVAVAQERRLVAEGQRDDGRERQAEDAAAEQARLEADAPVERRGVGRRNVLKLPLL